MSCAIYYYLIGQCRSDYPFEGSGLREASLRNFATGDEYLNHLPWALASTYIILLPSIPYHSSSSTKFSTLFSVPVNLSIVAYPTFSSQGNHQSPESPPLQRPSSVFHRDHSSQTPCPPQASSNCKLVRLTRPGGHKTNLTKTPKSLHFPLPAHLPLLRDHRPNHRLLSHRSRTGPAALAVIVQSVSMGHFLQ